MCLSTCLFFESHYKCDFLVKPCLIPQPQADLVASFLTVPCYNYYTSDAFIYSSIIILPYFNINICSICSRY